MGNAASSKDRHDDTVDFGALYPQGIYTGPQDWNQNVVGQAIVERKLAPFYRPLEDYEEDWDDDRILAARKEPPPPPPPPANSSGTNNPSTGTYNPTDHQAHAHSHSASSQISGSGRTHKSARAASKEPQRLNEAKVYKGATECPICFMYYPPNINRSRCCDQAICTECFVQIKRSEPTPTHLVSEPACCPYCVQDNFGVVYTPPSWRTGIGADGPVRPDLYKLSSSTSDVATGPTGASKMRRKSATHTSDEVITTDQIRPDWEAKLNAVKAAVARRANRRIIMRQVGDRLIPVGVTSGRIHPIGEGTSTAEGGPEGESSARRSRRRERAAAAAAGGGGELGQLLNQMGIGMGGQDLEEILLQEAMRLSLLEHEAEQRRNQQSQNGNSGNSASTPPSGRNTANLAEPLLSVLGRGTSGSSSVSPSRSRTRSVSPSSSRHAPEHVDESTVRRRSHIPVISSPLGNASAGIALALGLPSPTDGTLPVPPTHQGGDNSSRGSTSHSRDSSRTHSRHGSQTNQFSAMAAAIGAANTAIAFIPPADTPERSTPEPAAITHQSNPSLPQLPVLVSASDLNEDIFNAPRGDAISSSAIPSSASHPDLEDSVQAPRSDSTDPIAPSLPSHQSQQDLQHGAAALAPSLDTGVTHDVPTSIGQTPSTVETPSTDEHTSGSSWRTRDDQGSSSSSLTSVGATSAPLAIGSSGAHTPAKDPGPISSLDDDSIHGEAGSKPYHVLPSTPDLMSTVPLLSDTRNESFTSTNTDREVLG